MGFYALCEFHYALNLFFQQFGRRLMDGFFRRRFIFKDLVIVLTSFVTIVPRDLYIECHFYEYPVTKWIMLSSIYPINSIVKTLNRVVYSLGARIMWDTAVHILQGRWLLVLPE